METGAVGSDPLEFFASGAFEFENPEGSSGKSLIFNSSGDKAYFVRPWKPARSALATVVALGTAVAFLQVARSLDLLRESNFHYRMASVVFVPIAMWCIWAIVRGRRDFRVASDLEMEREILVLRQDHLIPRLSRKFSIHEGSNCLGWFYKPAFPKQNDELWQVFGKTGELCALVEKALNLGMNQHYSFTTGGINPGLGIIYVIKNPSGSMIGRFDRVRVDTEIRYRLQLEKECEIDKRLLCAVGMVLSRCQPTYWWNVFPGPDRHSDWR